MISFGSKINAVVCLTTLGLANVAYAADVSTAEINGTTIEYVDVGTGDSIVLVHGAIGDLRAWDYYVEELSKTNRVISYTRRFYGKQEWPEGEVKYSHDTHAEDLAALIQELDAAPASLVSWSSGSNAASIVAKEYPDLVASLTYYEPVLASGQELMKDVEGYEEAAAEWGAQWAPVGEQLKAGDVEEASRKFTEVVFEMDPGGFSTLPKNNQIIILDNARTIPIMFQSEAGKVTDCDYLEAIKQPATVVLGSTTNKAWSMESRRVSECLSSAELEIIKDANHAGPITNFTEVVELIVEQASTD